MAKAAAKRKRPSSAKPIDEEAVAKIDATAKPLKKSNYQPLKSSLPQAVGTSELASLLGITERWLTALVSEGVIVKAQRGTYPLRASVQAFVAYSKNAERQKVASTTADAVREKRAEEIARRMAREDRILIEKTEAIDCVERITGRFLGALTGLSARISADPSERARIDPIIDILRDELSAGFVEDAGALRTGRSAAEGADEDDA